mmetsp:Transcript_93100/g.161384  ORF Transcript_93100/g.161384 Transcript_93100/m.161384 type:complete len:89 (-) Transcript_93100:693-959(-)
MGMYGERTATDTHNGLVKRCGSVDPPPTPRCMSHRKDPQCGAQKLGITPILQFLSCFPPTLSHVFSRKCPEISLQNAAIVASREDSAS